MKIQIISLRNISYGQTLQQKNGYNCGLFAFVILLHLVYGIKIKENIYSQKTIDYFIYCFKGTRE
jgi:hypothetical protein